MTDRLPHADPDARVLVHTGFHRGPIGRRLFGSFVEHMGRCVYTGIYQPGHPTADAAGFRADVEGLVRELGVTLVRYPGGNFVSGYDWTDGIGPRADRPTRFDLAWRSVETNQVGPDEFIPWARRLGLEPMMAVNLGTAGVTEAAALVEYCNGDARTEFARRRRENGSQDPYRVPLWCLGNEMDGPWQLGHRSAAEYASLAAQAGHAMKLVDPSIQLVACGSSNREMATFGAWDQTVLEQTWDVADYLSLHAYYDGQQDRADFLASGWRMDRYLDDVIAIMDAVRARRRSDKIMKIAFDEWNVWSSAPHITRDRPVVEAPAIAEDPYQAVDAVVAGDLMVSLLNHSDRVAVACLSLLVNVSAPIITDPTGGVSRQTIFHPMAVSARLARGNSLSCLVTTPQISSPRHGDLPAVAAAVTHDTENGTVAAFLVNRSDRPIDTSIAIDDLVVSTVAEAITIAADGADPVAVGEDAPAPGPLPGVRLDDGRVRVRLPGTSWSALSLVVEGR